MSAFDYDLFIIGAGSGGVRAARIAAGHGAKVGIAEEYRVGGTCVIRGCVPKKLFFYAAHFAEDFADAAGYGWHLRGHPRFDWTQLIAHKDKEIDRLNGLYIQTLQSAGVDLFETRASLADAHVIDLGDKKCSARTILIATGGTPFIPDIPGIEHAFTSNEAFHLEKLPKRVIVAGGGYIATEFAGIFNGLGLEVTQLYRRDLILRGFDDELRQRAMQAMAAKGVTFHLNASLTRLEKTPDGALCAHLSDGAILEADGVMLAIGRTPNTQGLGLEKAGLALADNGAVIVDAYSRTNVDHIYAVGDVTDRVALTPVAIREGHAFADSVFGGTPTRVDHEFVPSAVFSSPPIATIGYTEAEARTAFDDIAVFKSDFRPMRHTLAGRGERALTKLIVDTASERVVGAHMIGPNAPEIMQGIAIALKMGAKKSDFDATLAIHPTSAEEFVLMRRPA
ncbi:MAG: glutathione-disulfide reductase [Pseudomonadota bacterium]